MAMDNIQIERRSRLDPLTSEGIDIKDIRVFLNGALMRPLLIDSVYDPRNRTFEIDMRFSLDEFMRKTSAIEIHNMLRNGFSNHLMGVDNSMMIRKVIFNDPATIVFWEDGTKTVVKCHNEQYDPEKGLAMAIAKKACGNRGSYYGIFKKYLNEYEAQKLPEFDFGKQMTFSDALNNFKEAMCSTFDNNKNKGVFLE